MKKKFAFFLIIWFLVLVIVAFWIWRKNIYSKEVLELEILGPETVEVGEEIEYVLKYRNKGEVRLEEVKLFFEYPEYSSPSDSQPLRVVKDLDDIYPGQEVSLRFRGRLFGKKGETKIAKAFLNYRPKNLKSFYESETTHAVKIEFVPLTFEFDLTSRIEPGRSTKFSLNYFSNSLQPFFDLAVKIEYPSGFEFVSSNPPALEETEWEIGLLNKAEGGRIDIRGILSGDIGQQKIFRAQLGVWQGEEFIILKEIFKGVEIVRPRISVFQQINGSSEYIANPGDLLHYEVFFRNIGETPFEDLFLVVRLEGRAFDFDSMKSVLGRLNKADSSMVWDWRDVSELRFLGQGEEGKVEFWVNLKGEREMKNLKGKNFTFKNIVLLSQLKEEFVTKINSRLEISQKGFFEDEVFGNSGPLPPRVNKTTTYTIIWQVKNLYNDVKDIRVKATLPENVKLTGEIFPKEEASKFAFDSRSREIVWEVGDLRAPQGALTSASNIVFQVALEPTKEQVGQILPVIGQAKVYGEDEFTQTRLESFAEMIDTTLPDDDTVTDEMGKVQGQENEE